MIAFAGICTLSEYFPSSFKWFSIVEWKFYNSGISELCRPTNSVKALTFCFSDIKHGRQVIFG